MLLSLLWRPPIFFLFLSLCFLFVCLVWGFFFVILDSTCKWYYAVSVFLCLTFSLNIEQSRSIHAITKSNISLLFMAKFERHTFFIHSSIDENLLNKKVILGNSLIIFIISIISRVCLSIYLCLLQFLSLMFYTFQSTGLMAPQLNLFLGVLFFWCNCKRDYFLISILIVCGQCIEMQEVCNWFSVLHLVEFIYV